MLQRITQCVTEAMCKLGSQRTIVMETVYFQIKLLHAQQYWNLSLGMSHVVWCVCVCTEFLPVVSKESFKMLLLSGPGRLKKVLIKCSLSEFF